MMKMGKERGCEKEEEEKKEKRYRTEGCVGGDMEAHSLILIFYLFLLYVNISLKSPMGMWNKCMYVSLVSLLCH